MEYWDLLDAARRPLGRRHRRGTPLPPGTYHATVFVWVADARGQFLLTRRAPEKKAYPNCWGCTGGAVLAGEDSRSGAVRELWEETGLQAAPAALHLVCTVQEKDMFSDIYFWRAAGSPQVRLQPGETVEAGWFTLAQMADLQDLAEPDRRRLTQIGAQLQALTADCSR